jgi:putrescine transport system ATP-binding protein
MTTRDAGTVVAAEPQPPGDNTAVCVAIRPEKVKLSRRGPASDTDLGGVLNRLKGEVSDVSYFGGSTSYTVRLDAGATLKASMANTARLDLDAYAAGQRVVAWFSPDDCMVLAP